MRMQRDVYTLGDKCILRRTHRERDTHPYIYCIDTITKLCSLTGTTIKSGETVLWSSCLPDPQAVLSDDGVGIWLGEPDPPEEPLTLQVSVPPHQLRLEKLLPHTPYHIRVSCTSSQGPSPWTHWLPVETTEGGKKVLGGKCHCALLCASFSSHPVTPHGLRLLVQPLTPACWPLPRSLPELPLMEGLQELPTRVLFATCPTSWEQGRGSRRGGGTSFPLPCPPVPLGPPENVSAMRNGSQALVRWQEPRVPLQGTLLGYRLAYRGQDTPEVGAAGWVRVVWLWEEGTGEEVTK